MQSAGQIKKDVDPQGSTPSNGYCTRGEGVAQRDGALREGERRVASVKHTKANYVSIVLLTGS
jgi:hypothetical protein